MIGFINGTVFKKGSNYLLVETALGLAFKVFTLATTIGTNQVGDKVALLTHLAVRENALDLFGFPQEEELELFELMISVSGIGPKSALSILNQATIEEIKTSVINSEHTILTRVSGIGKKTAERIVLELRNKIKQDDSSPAVPGVNSLPQDDLEILEALEALGYKALEARTALGFLRKEKAQGQSFNERLKIALRYLGK